MSTPNIPQEIRELATFIEDRAAKLDTTDDGVKSKLSLGRGFIKDLLKEAPETLRANLPTHEEIEKVYTFESNLSDATTLATGNIGLRRMKENTGFQMQTLAVPVAVGGLSRQVVSTYNRDGKSHNPRTGETTEFHGDASTRLTALKGSKVSRYADIKSMLRAQAGTELAK